jgi:hypothetical protein
MNPELSKYFRIRSAPPKTILEIETIRWHGAHTPYGKWKAFRAWSSPPTKADLASAENDALADPEYFRTCSLCHELLPAGHTISLPEPCCHYCAESKHGVLF